MTRPSHAARFRVRTAALITAIAVLVQAALGMLVNLHVTVPAHHPGARPSDYFGGSFHSVVWAIGHGSPALALHAAFGVALVCWVLVFAVRALGSRRDAAALWSTVAALLVVGAAFNGASFLDFADNTSSLLMALLAFAAVGCYAAALFLLAVY